MSDDTAAADILEACGAFSPQTLMLIKSRLTGPTSDNHSSPDKKSLGCNEIHFHSPPSPCTPPLRRQVCLNLSMTMLKQ